MNDKDAEIKSLKQQAAKDKAMLSYLGTQLFANKFDWYNLDQCSPPIFLLKKMILATDIRPSSGVYFLIHGDSVVYVGKSSNVIARMGGHKHKQYDRAIMIHESDGQIIDALERTFIALFKPKYNKSEHASPMIHPKIAPHKKEYEKLLAGKLEEPEHDNYHA